jgi:ABC-2 type transport system permease protein
MMDLDKQMTGFTTIMLYTIRKLLLSKRLYITLLIMVFIVAIMAYGSTLELTEQQKLDGVTKVDEGVNLLDSLILFFFMPVMAMIYGSSLIRDEMDDKSITSVVTSPMDRMITYTAYYIGLAISVSLIMLLLITALMVIGSFAYSALFIMVSVLISKPMYFGLFYAFIWEGFIGSIEGKIQLLSVKHYIRSLGSHWLHDGNIEVYDMASSATTCSGRRSSRRSVPKDGSQAPDGFQEGRVPDVLDLGPSPLGHLGHLVDELSI